jgi:hypothetical protein
MTEEEAILIGTRLQQIVNDDAFQTALKVMDHQYKTSMFLTQPSDREAREQLYAEYHGFRNLVATMASLITQADMILAERLAEAEEE